MEIDSAPISGWLPPSGIDFLHFLLFPSIAAGVSEDHVRDVKNQVECCCYTHRSLNIGFGLLNKKKILRPLTATFSLSFMDYRFLLIEFPLATLGIKTWNKNPWWPVRVDRPCDAQERIIMAISSTAGKISYPLSSADWPLIAGKKKSAPGSTWSTQFFID